MKFEILGKPVAKGRPKFARRGKFTTAYTPEKTATYENLVKVMYQQAGGKIFDGEIDMFITAYFELPKSATKKVRANIANYPHLIKPDCDNLAKIICDALNGYAYKDDSQITGLVVTKKYAEVAKVVVHIELGSLNTPVTV